MTEPDHGHVILHSYLWAREYERSEESGRKARPTCLMLITGKNDRRKAMPFPITSQPSVTGARCRALR